MSRAGAARLAVPGDLATPTGGYVYDARVIAASGGALTPLALPAGFPAPDDADLSAARAALMATSGPLLVDGLAYGALPAELIDALPRRPVALCHHPLGLEAGLSPAEAERLIASERAALARAAHTIVTSPATKRTLVADFGLTDDAVTVAEPGLDRAPPANSYRDIDHMRGTGEPRGEAPTSRRVAPEARNLDAAAPVILCVASLTRRKGHDVLIDALARIADRPWGCLFAGPDDRDGAWAGEITARISAAGLDHRITRLGPQDADGLEALYAGADLFCLPSRYEGYGMVFAEAMMRALPVVACVAGAVPDVVPAAAGRLVAVDNADALAAALTAMLDDAGARRKAAAAARAHALTLPDWAATWGVVGDVLKRFG